MNNKKIKLAINGFGRIGRLLFRKVCGDPGIDVVAINDLSNIDNLAYLLKYDTVYGRYKNEITVERGDGHGTLVVGGDKIAVLQEPNPEKLPWKKMGVDIAVEATGVFTNFEQARVHLKAGAKRVVITAPAKDEEQKDAKTTLIGINEENFKTCKITSNGSCTTNATHPVAAIMSETVGIKKAMLSTVHGYTAAQSLIDGITKKKDFRRGRAAAANIVPSTTGAAISVTRALPNLEGKFDGISLRVPVLVGSIVDFTFLTKKKTTVEAVNDIFRKAAKDPRWRDILTVTEDQIVSADIIGEPYGAIIDLSYTRVVDGDLVKVLSWYDNEWGYIQTLAEHIKRAAETL